MHDGHDGAHSSELRIAPRRLPQVRTPPTRHSPRLTRCFAWNALGPELQATVLLHLECAPDELLRLLTHLSRHIRSIRPAILYALRLDPQLSRALDATWEAVVFNQAFPKFFLWSHSYRLRTLLFEPVGEWLDVRVRLEWRGVESPRLWRWKFELSWYVDANVHGLDQRVALEFDVAATACLGMPLRGQQRRHCVLKGTGKVRAVSTATVLGCGCTTCGRDMFDCLSHVALTTRPDSALRMSMNHRMQLEWSLSDEALVVMRLVSTLLH